jgi:hypothetical protein
MRSPRRSSSGLMTWRSGPGSCGLGGLDVRHADAIVESGQGRYHGRGYHHALWPGLVKHSTHFKHDACRQPIPMPRALFQQREHQIDARHPLRYKDAGKPGAPDDPSRRRRRYPRRRQYRGGSRSSASARAWRRSAPRSHLHSGHFALLSRGGPRSHGDRVGANPVPLRRPPPNPAAISRTEETITGSHLHGAVEVTAQALTSSAIEPSSRTGNRFFSSSRRRSRFSGARLAQ